VPGPYLIVLLDPPLSRAQHGRKNLGAGLEGGYCAAIPDPRIEVLVEPFRENDPGPHVTAVIECMEWADR